MKKVLLVLLLLHCSLFCVGAHVKNMELIFYWYEGYAPYRLIFPYKVKQDYLTINPVQRLIGYKLQTDVSDILSFKPIPSKISIRNLDEGIASLTKKKAKFLISHEDIDKLNSLLLSERKFSDEKKKAILQKAYELSKLPSDSLVSLFRSHSTNVADASGSACRAASTCSSGMTTPTILCSRRMASRERRASMCSIFMTLSRDKYCKARRLPSIPLVLLPS